MNDTPRLLFLPGASGTGGFWSPVAERLPDRWPKTLLSWPGVGDQPHDHRVSGWQDLVGFAALALHDQSDLIAQSMGAVVAIGLALRHPEKVRRLVLVATSGGIDAAELGAADWRPGYRRQYPRAAPWVWQQRLHFTDALTTLHTPTLLLWGDADPISPVAVGKRLAELLPGAALHILPAATHNLAREYPDEVAGLIAGHLE